MTEPLDTNPNVRVRFEVTDDDRVQIWSREGMTREAVVALLRKMADGFESGDVSRVK